MIMTNMKLCINLKKKNDQYFNLISNASGDEQL